MCRFLRVLLAVFGVSWSASVTPATAGSASATVAMLDSGVDVTHPDLTGSLVGEHCFCRNGDGSGCCPDGSTEQDGPGSAADDNGNGTFLAGIITANGVLAPVGGAPDAGIVAVKVMDQDTGFFNEQIVAGLNWILSHRPDVKIVTTGAATFELFAGDCGSLSPPNPIATSYAQVIDALTARGTLVIVPSGNNCSGEWMSAPACVANALAVGAVYAADIGGVNYPTVACEGPARSCRDATTSTDQVTCFSNSNASTDLFAPGTDITSAWNDGGVRTASGTQVAAAMAAACAATLLEVAPTLRPDQLEMLLEGSTTLVTDSRNGLSFPRLDCEESHAALRALLPTASPTVTPTATITATVTATATAPRCRGDCDANSRVTVDEIVLGVRIALEIESAGRCRSVDADMDGRVRVNELVLAVANALSGCVLRSVGTHM